MFELVTPLKKKTCKTKQYKAGGKWKKLIFLSFPFHTQLNSMKMRNPLKPKNKSRRFAELQDDPGFSDAQFEQTDKPSKD